MESSARYALCIGLTNVPNGTEWDTLIRLSKLLKGALEGPTFNKIYKNLSKREPYVILDIISLLSIDEEEYQHLKHCLYKNEMAKAGGGNSNADEIYVEEEYWKVAQLDASRH